MRLKNLISAFLILLSFGVFSQSLNVERLDSLFEALEKNNKAMGSIAIRVDGEVLYTRSIGYQSILDQQKATENTKYRIGSITKMFTAVIIFKLIEEGKLSLRDKLNTYFPSIDNAEKITISHLLQHKSGIFNFTALPDYTDWDTYPKTQAEIVDIIRDAGSVFTPGTKSEYSNSNYVLLGYVIEKITEKSYANCVREYITGKLKLKSTYVGEQHKPKLFEAYSYDYNTAWTQASITDMSIPGAAGAIVSTPTELTQFIEELFAGKLISSTSLDSMTSFSGGYGRGIFPIPFYNHTFYGHTGGIDGFGSTLSYNKEEELSIAYCTNGQSYPMNDILIGVLSIYFDRPYTIPDFQSIAVTDRNRTELSGEYTSSSMPLDIKVFYKDGRMYAQATGQAAFPLNHKGNNVFTFDAAGIHMVFSSGEDQMTFRQAGQTFLYTKKK